MHIIFSYKFIKKRLKNTVNRSKDDLMNCALITFLGFKHKKLDISLPTLVNKRECKVLTEENIIFRIK